jgi:hypothetical protein
MKPIIIQPREDNLMEEQYYVPIDLFYDGGPISQMSWQIRQNIPKELV